jgi:hypothetical protein
VLAGVLPSTGWCEHDTKAEVNVRNRPNKMTDFFINPPEIILLPNFIKVKARKFADTIDLVDSQMKRKFIGLK